MAPLRQGRGPIGPWTDLSGQSCPISSAAMELPRLAAPGAGMETPLIWSYRNSGRFYVECRNETKPGNEIWYYDQAQGRLVGCDRYYHHLLGSFGPDGFTPAGAATGEALPGRASIPHQSLATSIPAFPGFS